LDKLVGGSLLVKGFSHELTSLPLILAAIHRQNSEIASGNASDTGEPPEFFLPPPAPGNGLNTLDPGTYQNAAHPPLTAAQLQSLASGQSQGVGPGGRGIVPIGLP
jgi:hypothetical protein